MKRFKSLSKFAVLFLLQSTLLIASEKALYAENIRIERHKAIAMRDGVKLFADIYLPAKPGKYPTIVTRNCYGPRLDGLFQEWVKFAQNGYAVVVQDVRGRYESEGVWEPFRD